MAYNPHTWVNYHVPAINETHLNEMENGIVSAHTLSDPASRVCYVSPGFAVDTDYRRFDTIQAAITFIHDSSWYGDLSKEQSATVFVFPGDYKEQITSWDYIKTMSAPDKDNQGDKKTVQIRPPDDKKTEPILVSGADHVYNFIGITFTADSVEHGPYATAINARFYNCRFNEGSFLDGSEAYSCGILFVGCTFNAPTPINYTGVRGHADRSIYLYDSYGYADIVLNSTFATGSPYFEAMNSHFKANLTVGGAWSAQIINCRVRNYTGSPNRSNFDTTGDIILTGTKLSGGLHFVSDPGSLCIEHCDFNEYGATVITGTDVTADVDITDICYNHNIQQNGICGCIQIQNPEKNVGAGRVNRYYSLQDAVTSVPAGSEGTVRFWENLTGLAEITLPNANVNIKIKGQKSYSLSFTGDIVEIGNDRILGFNDITQLTGGNIELNGTSNELGFESCQYINAYVTLTAGTFAILYNSSLFGSAGHKAIYINNTDTITVVGYSRVQGATGQPAIEFNANADTKLKAKFSTFIHGDKSTTCPLLNSTVTPSINIALYLCGVNKIWNSPNPFLNVIAKPGNTDDEDINF